MGLVSRSTAAALLLAAPAVVAGAVVAGPASAGTRAPAQTSDGKVAANAQFKFDPATITVAVGGKVTWTNTGGGYHTVTGGDGTKDPASPMQGVIDTQGKTYTVTFDKPGTYKYYCEPHVAAFGMKGEVVVAGAGGGASPVPSPANSGGGASSAPPASGGASASVGAPQAGVGAPTPGASADPEEDELADNETIKSIEAERAAQHGAVSGFRFFTMVAVAFLVILGVAVAFSTRPRRAGR